MKIKEISTKYNLSFRSLAALFGVTAPTFIYWEKHHNGEIPEKFESPILEAMSSIDEIIEKSGFAPKDAIPLILEFRRSPFWKNWDHLKKVLIPQKDQSILTRDIFLKAEFFIHTHHKGLIAIENSNIRDSYFINGFDFSYHDKRECMIFGLIYDKTISFKDILQGLTNIEKARSIYPNSIFYIFARKIENSVRFALEEEVYIRMVSLKESNDNEFELI